MHLLEMQRNFSWSGKLHECIVYWSTLVFTLFSYPDPHPPRQVCCCYFNRCCNYLKFTSKTAFIKRSKVFYLFPWGDRTGSSDRGNSTVPWSCLLSVTTGFIHWQTRLPTRPPPRTQAYKSEKGILGLLPPLDHIRAVRIFSFFGPLPLKWQ